MGDTGPGAPWRAAFPACGLSLSLSLSSIDTHIIKLYKDIYMHMNIIYIYIHTYIYIYIFRSSEGPRAPEVQIGHDW